MRLRTLMIALMIALLGAGTALAVSPGYGQGMRGPGSGMGMGPGKCGGPGMRGAAPAEPVSEEQARQLINEQIASLKGYQLEKIEAFERPRGTMYAASVKDAAGNAFTFHVNPWGKVRGPFPVQQQ